MQKKYSLLMLAACFTHCYGAESSTLSPSGRVEGFFALHNPTRSAHVKVLHPLGLRKEFELTFRPTEDASSKKCVKFIKNALYLSGKKILSPVSVYVSGGAAENPFEGPEDQPRTFKYLPALRYVVLQYIPKQARRDLPSIDSLETVYPQAASYAEEIKQRKNKADKYTPCEVQHMNSLTEVLMHYQETKNPTLIIDLKAALAHCNLNWEHEYPIRQIPMVLTYLRGNISCRPYEDMTREQMEAHENEERERANSSECSVQ